MGRAIKAGGGVFSYYLLSIFQGAWQTQAGLMKTSTKAVLLSALVFPGTGHLLLKKYLSAAVLAGACFFGLYYLISSAVDTALEVSAELQSGNVQPDVAAISDLLAKRTSGSDAQVTSLVTAAIGICWIFGVVDSYRVGRAQERAARAQNPVS